MVEKFIICTTNEEVLTNLFNIIKLPHVVAHTHEINCLPNKLAQILWLFENDTAVVGKNKSGVLIILDECTGWFLVLHIHR